METPSARTLRLLAVMRTGTSWTAHDLAARLEVSHRTVRRDIHRLRELGYRIESTPGPGGHYRLVPSIKIPPLLLTADEVTVLTAALLAHEATAPDTDTARLLRIKLEELLPSSLQRRARATALTTQVISTQTPPIDWPLLGLIGETITDSHDLTFTYTDQHGVTSQRHATPYRHVLRNDRWYLIAHDHDRGDWRTFRLDRIRHAANHPQQHEPPDFPAGSIDDWLASDFGRNGYRPTTMDGPGAGGTSPTGR